MIGRVHCRSARAAGADVVGLLGRVPERGKEAAAAWDIAKSFRTLDDLLQSEAEVVHICTPDFLHFDMALAALRAGKHVICEKPLSLTLERARQLDETAQRAGLVATIPFVYRFYPMVREAHARTLAGDIGSIPLIHGSYLQDWLSEPTANNWRVNVASGGASRAFADIGSHWCDLLEWVCGIRLERAIALCRTVYPIRNAAAAETFKARSSVVGRQAEVATEDIAQCLFQTSDGIAITLTVSQVSRGHKNQLSFEIDGALASLSFSQENPEHLRIGRSGGIEVLTRDPSQGTYDANRLSLLPPGHPQGYADCLDAFIGDTYAGTRGEVRDGLPLFRDGVRSLAITEAVMRSAKSGVWETIESIGDVA
jgi:predicted dehydrogenase